MVAAASAAHGLDFEKLIGHEVRKELERRGDSGKSSTPKKKSSSSSSSRSDRDKDRDRRDHEEENRHRDDDCDRHDVDDRFERYHYAPIRGWTSDGFSSRTWSAPYPPPLLPPGYDAQYPESRIWVEPPVIYPESVLHRGDDGSGADPRTAYALGSVEALVQERLRGMGYYRGRVDGIIGSESRSAIAEYQITQGLPVSGRIDLMLLRSLGLVAD